MKTERSSKRRKLSPPADDSVEPVAQKRRTRKDSKFVSTETQPDEVGVSPSAEHDLSIPSVKGLDSSEPAVRRSTLKTIQIHLVNRPTSNPFSPVQCLQLWRGFSVAVYMHDSRNALSVQTLLREIANTFVTLSAKDDEVNKFATRGSEFTNLSDSWVYPYHIAFWETMQGEWTRIDSHRMNKYLLLVRFVMRILFTICLRPAFQRMVTSDKPTPMPKSKSKKDPKKDPKQEEEAPLEDARAIRAVWRTTRCVEVLATLGPLNPSLRKIPDGLRLHVLDVWNDELAGAISDLEESEELDKFDSEDIEKREKELSLLFQSLQTPLRMISVSNSGAQKHVRSRAKEAIVGMNEFLKEKGIAVAE